MSTLDLAVIGNCSYSALIDRQGRIVWSCLPRFDGDPVFCSLMNGDDEEFGFFDFEIQDLARTEQHYLHNSAVLVTTLFDRHGAAVEITDFAPRFKQLGRVYRPIMVVRQIRPVIGSPRISVRLRPAADYGARRPEITHGSNHVRYVMPTITLRLTTDVPISYVLDEVPFVLDEACTLILGPDETLNKPIADAGRDYREQTGGYWREWARYLSIPFEWQDAVIRAAITLKLCAFEETGAIVAAMTTSIPESKRPERQGDKLT